MLANITRGEPGARALSRGPEAALKQMGSDQALCYSHDEVLVLIKGDIEICASKPVPIDTTPPANDVPSQVLELTNGPSGPEIVWQMTVKPGGAYRSYRIPSLYPRADLVGVDRISVAAGNRVC